MDLLEEPSHTPQKRKTQDADDADPATSSTGQPASEQKKARTLGVVKPCVGGPPKQAKKCLACSEEVVGRLRWCRHHKQLQDSMYYHLIEKPFAKMKEGDADAVARKNAMKEQWKNDMVDDNHAIKMIQEFEKDNISGRKFRKGITWADFSRTFETRTGERTENRARPVEKAEYILRLVNKKGWSRTSVG